MVKYEVKYTLLRSVYSTIWLLLLDFRNRERGEKNERRWRKI